MSKKEINLTGYRLEKYKKGWVIVKGTKYLSFGDDYGDLDEDEWYWADERHPDTRYFENPQEAKDQLKEVLESWNEEEAEFQQRPTEVITL